MEATLTKEEKMKSLLSLVLVAIFATFMLTACLVSPGPGGYGVEVAPPLPAVIELDVGQPYYYQGGYHYFYQNDRWQYSRSRSGPWTELPRSHWPKEIKQRGGENRREHEHEHDGR
jgi:hypothetical protein